MERDGRRAVGGGKGVRELYGKEDGEEDKDEEWNK